MKNIKIIAILAILAIINSCSESAQTPKGEFAKGVIIINEGNFTQANGTVSFYQESNEEVTQDIFAKVNGFSPGGLIQSVYIDENKAFIIDNLGSKIYVVEAGTFELLHTIEEGLRAPRYMIVFDGKAYVTNWGPFDANYNLPNSYVAVIDLASYEVTGSITTDSGCEGLFVFGEKVYAANSFSNTVDIIDPVRGSVVDQITVENGPQSFVEDKNGAVWLLSSSFAGPSYLTSLNLSSDEVVNSLAIAPSAKALKINGAGDELYYLSAPYGQDAGVFNHAIAAQEVNLTPIISAPNIYGLGIHPASGEIYLANHNSFQGNGTVLIYSGNNLKSSFPSGIGPNGFVFR